jgi:UDP-glucose 4-epimerase
VRNQIEVFNNCVTDFNRVEEAVDGTDTVFHLAANASVPKSVEEPLHDFSVNAEGTTNLLRASVINDVDQVVFASSAAVYGNPEYVPIDETHPLEPDSPYGASKLAGEKLGFAYNSTYDLDFRAARIFNTYGPRQSRYVMYDFIEKLKQDPSELEVLGDGEQIRDYIYVTDTVRALQYICVRGESDAYNLAGDSSVSIAELAEMMVELIAPAAEIHYTGNTWKGDIKRLKSDTTKLDQLGFEPSVSLSSGLQKLIDWHGQVTQKKVLQ